MERHKASITGPFFGLLKWGTQLLVRWKHLRYGGSMGSRNYSERSLIEGAKTSNAKSFNRLFFVHQKYLFNLLYQLCGDIALSDDLTQETMIQAYKKIRHFRCESSFRIWLSRIAINLFCKEAKKRPKSEHLPFDGIQILDKGDHFERIVMRGQLQR